MAGADTAGSSAARIQAGRCRALQAAVQFLLAHGRDVLFGALGLSATSSLMLFVLFFFFRDGDAHAARAIELDPARARDARTRLAATCRTSRGPSSFGTVVTALAQGALIGIGFWITGLPSPAGLRRPRGRRLVHSVRRHRRSSGCRPSLYLLARASRGRRSSWLVWSAVWSSGSADNFLRPLLVSGKAQIGTLTVFFGVLGGLAAFGLVGLFLGPVILALVLALIEFAEEDEAAAAEPPAG